MLIPMYHIPSTHRAAPPAGAAAVPQSTVYIIGPPLQHRQNIRIQFHCGIVIVILMCAAGAGVFELQILEFSNYRLELASGACCGGDVHASPSPAPSPVPGGVAGCARPCRTRFALCLKEYQSVAAPGACSFGREDSPVLGTDSFTLAEPLYTLALPFTFRWTRSFTLVLQAFDEYEYPEPEGALIEEAWWSGIVEPGAAWHALRFAGARAALAYRVRVLCQPNYYNTTCTTFCRPRDDKFGHYACETSGSKRCLPGWQGDNCEKRECILTAPNKRCLPGWQGDNCEKPVCKEGCHPTHGRCDRPGDCDCRPGWRGALCAQCQPYPGCKHGYCNGSSWDCTCDTNWGGILCDQGMYASACHVTWLYSARPLTVAPLSPADLNYCGTHEPCQHGGTCENTAPDQYLCRCAEGFSGVDCERVDNPCAPQPCAHGACALEGGGTGFSCACERGWGGALCDVDLDDCASAPCRHGATCRDHLDAFTCDCAPGWSGATCEEDVDECASSPPARAEGADAATGPCVNAAACNNTPGSYSCTCLAGWTGRDCDSNVDDCAAGPCLHGATCIDLVDDFHCACAAGYAGRTCALDVDECAPRPCLNGGECVDLPDAYRCICPVGFSGANCEDDRDHCAGAPCGNGAACYTAQSDYYCHCAPGWQGKNCTQRAAPAPPRCACDPGYTGMLCDEREYEYLTYYCHCAPPGWQGKNCTQRAAPAPPRCACDPGYTGVLCDEREYEYLTYYCHCAPGWQGKNCTQRAAPAPPRCACDPGYTGVLCDEREYEYLTYYCHCAPGWQGKKCTQRGAPAPPRCACDPGYTGVLCDEREYEHLTSTSLEVIDRCPEGACSNGGTCMREAGGWRCACTAGWGGVTCGAPLPPAACPFRAHSGVSGGAEVLSSHELSK
ncbi:Delta-like protein [Operophtera brumata]|uniref:Delta-like protein n=1 Tax=Operophtera brumata TaxID=104452 RepID=A0A0L7LP21_OPEBR|nr:Delta-like protein [Operophtera brumata]